MRVVLLFISFIAFRMAAFQLRLRWLLSLFNLGILGLVPFCWGQAFQETARSYQKSPAILGMGGAGVALPNQDQVFFYNPAGLPSVAQKRVRYSFLGLQAELSKSAITTLQFTQDRLVPALTDGLDQLSDEDLKALYRDALTTFRKEGLGVQAVPVLPAFVLRLSARTALGFGVFGDAKAEVNLMDGGAGIPVVIAQTQGDATALVGLGSALPSGLSLGGTVKYTQRFMSVKNKPLDGFDVDESFYLLKTQGFTLDLGFVWKVPSLSNLQVGGAAYDVLGRGMTFKPENIQALTEAPEREAEKTQNLAQANLRPRNPSYRFGLGYQIKLTKWLRMQLAADYAHAYHPLQVQSFPAHLYLGSSLQVGKTVFLRGGFSQGYPSMGASLDLGGLRISYAYYGVEAGRFPGQSARFFHTAEFILGNW